MNDDDDDDDDAWYQGIAVAADRGVCWTWKVFVYDSRAGTSRSLVGFGLVRAFRLVPLSSFVACIATRGFGEAARMREPILCHESRYSVFHDWKVARSRKNGRRQTKVRFSIARPINLPISNHQQMATDNWRYPWSSANRYSCVSLISRSIQSENLS